MSVREEQAEDERDRDAADAPHQPRAQLDQMFEQRRLRRVDIVGGHGNRLPSSARRPMFAVHSQIMGAAVCRSLFRRCIRARRRGGASRRWRRGAGCTLGTTGPKAASVLSRLTGGRGGGGPSSSTGAPGGGSVGSGDMSSGPKASRVVLSKSREASSIASRTWVSGIVAAAGRGSRAADLPRRRP